MMKQKEASHRELEWLRKYDVCRQKHLRDGNLCFTADELSNLDFDVRLWMIQQRSDLKRERLSDKRRALLEEISFFAEAEDETSVSQKKGWKEYYTICAERYRQYGTIYPPGNELLPEDLRAWIKRNKDDKRRGRMSVQRLKLLNEINFFEKRPFIERSGGITAIEAIRKRMYEKGVSYSELANMIGVTKGTLSNWFKPKAANCGYRKYFPVIAEVLGMDAEELERM